MKKKGLIIVASVLLFVGGSVHSFAEENSLEESTYSSTISTEETKELEIGKEEQTVQGRARASEENKTEEEKTTKVEGYEKYVENENIPKEMQDTWIGEYGGKTNTIILGARTIVSDEKEYQITAYGINGSTYTFMWSTEAFETKYGKQEKWNPQPFIYTYNKEKDTLETGLINYRRASTVAAEKNKEETPAPAYEKYLEKTDLPSVLQDTWVGEYEGKEIKIVLGARTILSNGKEHEVIGYGINGSTYTIMWSTEAYEAKYGKQDRWNPQPFICTYNEKNDTLEVGLVTYKRERAKAVDKETKKTETSGKKLPQTGEKKGDLLSLTGFIMLLIGGMYFVKKRNILM